MWFKNIKTGVKWEVTDNELIKRLSKDDNYLAIEEAEKVDKVEEVEEVKEVNYEDMLYNDLRQIAIDKGINTNKMKKADLVKALQELEG